MYSLRDESIEILIVVNNVTILKFDTMRQMTWTDVHD